MPQINPEILVWARETAKLSIAEAASQLGIKDSKTAAKEDKLLAYETGNNSPSRPLLIKMAKKYRRPLLSFYLNSPPTKGDRGEDFRTLPSIFEPSENAWVDALIRDVEARQSLIRSVLVEEDEAQKLPFIGTSNIDNKVTDVARKIENILGFSLDEFRNNKTPQKAFEYLRALAEDCGIFVLLIGNLGSHHTNINTNLFRGFVLADDIAPFIVINDQDSKPAWSFTLLHEIAHILIGRTGVSGGYAENKIEQFCNDVASETLLPNDEIDGIELTSDSFDGLTKEIHRIAFKRKISCRLIAYRLYRKNRLSKKDYLSLDKFFIEKWRELRTNQKANDSKKAGGPSYYVVRRHKLGNAIINLVQRMTQSGAMTPTKAGKALGVRPLKVFKLFETGNANKAA